MRKLRNQEGKKEREENGNKSELSDPLQLIQCMTVHIGFSDREWKRERYRAA